MTGRPGFAAATGVALAAFCAGAVLPGGGAAASAGAEGPATERPAGAPAAAAPRVHVMVAGRTRVLRPATSVVARAVRVRVGRRRCAVAAGTPIAALAALRTPSFAVRDFGGCSSRSPAASELLYVTRIGAERARGTSGWVYKVGRRALSLGGANPRARVRAGARVLWFYCRMGAVGCQRTLEVAGPARAAPGTPVRLAVRGYDDRGRGVAIAGARVRFAGASATTAADGTVTMTAPAGPGRPRAVADRPGLVPSFPFEVRVG